MHAGPQRYSRRAFDLPRGKEPGLAHIKRAERRQDKRGVRDSSLWHAGHERVLKRPFAIYHSICCRHRCASSPVCMQVYTYRGGCHFKPSTTLRFSYTRARVLSLFLPLPPLAVGSPLFSRAAHPPAPHASLNQDIMEKGGGGGALCAVSVCLAVFSALVDIEKRFTERAFELSIRFSVKCVQG